MTSLEAESPVYWIPLDTAPVENPATLFLSSDEGTSDIPQQQQLSPRDDNSLNSSTGNIQIDGSRWRQLQTDENRAFYIGPERLQIGANREFYVGYEGLQIGANRMIYIGFESLQIGDLFEFRKSRLRFGNICFGPKGFSWRKETPNVPSSLLENSIVAFLFTQGALWSAHAAKSHFLGLKHQWKFREGSWMTSGLVALVFSGLALTLGSKAVFNVKRITRTIKENIINEFENKHFLSSIRSNPPSLTSAGRHVISTVFFASVANATFWLTKRVGGFTYTKLGQAFSGTPIKMKTIFRGRFTPFQTPFYHLSPLAIAIPASVLTYKCAHINFSLLKKTLGHFFEATKDFAKVIGII